MVKNTWRTLKYNLTLSRFIQNLYPVSPINAGAKKSHGETEFGFSMMEVMISISVLSVMVAFAIPYFSGYQDDVKDQLHLVNSLTLRHGVESARIEGHISGPEPGNSVDVSIGDLESMGYSFDILDPSASGKKKYLDSTCVQIYNDNGALKYYIKLVSQDEHVYIDTLGSSNQAGSKEIHRLEKKNVKRK